MALTPVGQGRLRVFQACREGWVAFGRAPVPFLLYSLLSCLGYLATGALAMVGGLGVVAVPGGCPWRPVLVANPEASP